MKPATILFGTVTGNAEACAEELSASLTACGVPNRVMNMRDLSTEELPREDLIMVVTSTTGNGDPPYNAAELYRHLSDDRPKLDGLRFAVLAMGSRRFTHFAQCGKNFDAVLGELGAERIIERVDCDGHYEDPLDDFQKSLFGYFSAQSERYPDFKEPAPPPPPPPKPTPAPRSSTPAPSPQAPPKRRSVRRRVKNRIKRLIGRS